MNGKVLSFFILFLCGFYASAGIKFTPVQMNIDDFKRQKSTTVNIESTGISTSKIYEINAFKWEQNDKGEDILVKDDTLLFNPKIFELKPESKQLVRIGFSQSPANLKKEQAWRIIFEEITPVVDKSNLTFLFNFSLPLFAGKQVSPKLDVNIQKTSNTSYLNINNVADSHAKLIEIIVLDQNNKEIVKKNIVQYILSGKKVVVDLGDISVNGKLKLKIKLEDQAEYLEFPIKV